MRKFAPESLANIHNIDGFGVQENDVCVGVCSLSHRRNDANTRRFTPSRWLTQASLSVRPSVQYFSLSKHTQRFKLSTIRGALSRARPSRWDETDCVRVFVCITATTAIVSGANAFVFRDGLVARSRAYTFDTGGRVAIGARSIVCCLFVAAMCTLLR